MGLALLADGAPSENAAEFASPTSSAADAHKPELYVFGKGKGEGKGDGRCHNCNGEGHVARDCPLQPPVSLQAIKCLGCNGRGHIERQCPTAHPHLKNMKREKG